MELPPEPALLELIQRYASVKSRLGHEIGARPLVLPNATFFPDPYTQDRGSLEQLLLRLQAHAGMADVPIVASIATPSDDEEGQPASSCSSGACAPARVDATFQRVVDQGGTWHINVTEAELRHPVVLTTELARSLALIFLVETQEAGVPIESPLELTTEITAVALGMGSLLLQGSYIYAKSCGGPSITQVTALGPTELAVVTALFAASSNVSSKGLAGALPVTQQEAFNEALTFVRSNPELVAKLKAAPELVALGNFTLNESKSWLSRLFTPKKPDPELEALGFLGGETFTAKPLPARKPRSEQHAELKSLVNEAFDNEAFDRV